MSEPQQEKPVSVPDLLESVRRLAYEDVEGFGRLLDEIVRCESTSAAAMCKEAIALALELGYPDWELLDAVANGGLRRTLAFLRRQAEQHSARSDSAMVM